MLHLHYVQMCHVAHFIDEILQEYNRWLEFSRVRLVKYKEALIL